MRIFAVSDIHIDYDVNARWVANVSAADYRDDVLILAGDVTDELRSLEWCLSTLAARFKKVLFVPGNHELWVIRDGRYKTSWQKFSEVVVAAESSGASMQPFHTNDVSIVPLLGWYDYSFGEPGEELRSMWMDYRACRWSGLDVKQISERLASFNDRHVTGGCGKVITFSHFLPRIDLIPKALPRAMRFLDPVLGSKSLERQLRLLNSSIHVYGHSHINRNVEIDGVSYVNNAFGYPRETRIASKRFVCIHECQ
jgi:predicted phosphodiesterase